MFKHVMTNQVHKWKSYNKFCYYIFKKKLIIIRNHTICCYLVFGWLFSSMNCFKLWIMHSWSTMFKLLVVINNTYIWNKHKKIKLSTKLNFICDAYYIKAHSLSHHGREFKLGLVAMCTKGKLPKCFFLMEFETHGYYTMTSKCFLVCCATC